MTDLFNRLTSALADRYAIERELGAGGMATVYLARDLKHERQVAIKVLRPELAAALGAERFHQEIKIAANLNHPHILPLLDSGTAEEQPTAIPLYRRTPDEPSAFLYYVMPYVEGQSLRDKLAKEGELPIAEAVRILRDVLEALSHAHEHNVVHRDIKPDNVLLSERHALVTDFGVAKAVSEATGAHKLTTEGVALGTPAYMAPEQAAADPHIDHRADIYAVGVIAYELLTGRTPFVGNTQQELLAAHVTQSPDPVTKYRDSVPPALAGLVMKCLEKKAADRWQTAEELLPQLEALATPSGGVTPTEMVPVSAAARTKKTAIAAATAVVILVAILVVMLLPRGGGVTLDPERVLVAVFDNQTGDPSLGPLGVMAGHWITQGLQETGAVQVVPWLEAQQASRYVASGIDSGTVRDPVVALAEETGAATVVYGAYYRQADSVQYHADVIDANRGRTIGSLNPTAAPIGSPADAIEPLRQQLMGLLAIRSDERVTAQAHYALRPPSFEAYVAFDRGVQHYLSYEYREALPDLYAAFELDTTFVAALLPYAILSHRNLFQYAQADSLLGILEGYRNRLSAYDQAWWDYLRARVDGDYPAALRAIRRADELAPGSKAAYNRAFAARRLNRPREAVDALLTLAPERGPMRGWQAYYEELLKGYLELDEYERALKVTEDCRVVYGDSHYMLVWAATALVALGRVDEANRLAGDLVALPEEGLSQGYYLQFIAVYARRLGQTDVARATIQSAIQWYEDRTPETQAGDAWRDSYAWTLYLADSCDAAYAVAKPLSEQFPEDISRRGLVGILAACRGDREEALEISRWLEFLDRPYLLGANTLWRARIAGALGDGESAVALWRQAMAEGRGHPNPWDRYWICFEPIRDYEPWQELIRPKG